VPGFGSSIVYDLVRQASWLYSVKEPNVTVNYTFGASSRVSALFYESIDMH